MNVQRKELILKDEFYTILSHLGFSEFDHNVKFDKNMFDFPNKKGAQAVLYFLFIALGKDNEDFMNLIRDNYPVLNRKMEVHFRKGCYKGLAKISQKGTFTEMLPNTKSILFDPHGKMFYKLIYNFAVIVLHEVVSRAAASASVEVLPPPSKGSKTKILTEFRRKASQHTQNATLTFQQMSEDLKAVDLIQGTVRKIYSDLQKELEELKNHLSLSLKSLNISKSTCNSVLNDTTAVEWESKREEIEAQLTNLLQLRSYLDEILVKDENLFAGCEVPSPKRQEFCLDAQDFLSSLSPLGINILRENGVDINKFNLEKDGKLNLAACVSLVNYSLKLLIKRSRKVLPKLKSLKQMAPKDLYEENKKFLRFLYHYKSQFLDTISDAEENIKKIQNELTSYQEVKCSVSLWKKNFLSSTQSCNAVEYYGVKYSSGRTFSPSKSRLNVPKQRQIFSLESIGNGLDTSLKDLVREDAEGTNLPCNVSAYDILMTLLLSRKKSVFHSKSKRRLPDPSFQSDPVTGPSFQSKGSESIFCDDDDDESGFVTEELHVDSLEFHPYFADVRDILARYKKMKMSESGCSADASPNIKTDDQSCLMKGFTKKRRSIRMDKTVLETIEEEEDS